MSEETSMDQLFLAKVNEAIDNNLANENFGVDELAIEIGISRSQLHRRLNSLIGQSPSQMIKEFRLKRAMEMLQKKVATASEISYQVGFSSPSYFNRCFNEYFGYPPGKVKRMKSPGKTKNIYAPKKIIFLSLATLALIASGFVIYTIVSHRNTGPSIAVLPFDDMSPEKDQEYLSNGIAEDIISALTPIAGLKVIPRTSAFTFTDRNYSIREIGKELEVKTLLVGSIQKDGNNWRITARLINVIDGSILWSEQFNRNIRSYFEIQDEISLAVLDNLKIKLLGEEKAAVVKRFTQNLEAWEFYQRGNEYYYRSYEQKDFNIAIQMYQKAIESDPDFALAYTRLGMSHLFLYWFHHDRSEDRLIKSKQAIDAAFKIEPELIEAYYALGMYHYVKLDYSNALKQFEFALKQTPNNSECAFWIACVYRRTGKWEKAKEGFEKAFELDPRSSRIAFNAGLTYDLLRDYAKTIDYYDIAIMLRPDWGRPYHLKSLIYVKWNGNTRESRKIVKEAEQIITSTVEQIPLKHVLIRLELYDGNYEEAIKYLSLERFEAFQNQAYFIPRYQYFAQIYELMDNPELAYAYYDSSRIMLEDMLTVAPDDSRLYSSLGLAYAGLGRKKEAIDAGEKAVELLPVNKDAYRGTFRMEDLAQIYVMVGEYEEALTRIDTLLSIPSALSTHILQLDPVWKPLKDNPKFIKLIETYSEN